MQLAQHLFGSQGGVTLGQECARAVLILAYGLAAVRLVGRRVFARWSAIDIVVSIVVGSNLSRALTGNAPLLGTLAATSLLLGLHWFLANGAARWGAVSRVIEGRAVEIGRDGRIDGTEARRWNVSRADIDEALRRQGLEEASAARRIIVEPSGRLTVLRRER